MMQGFSIQRKGLYLSHPYRMQSTKQRQCSQNKHFNSNLNNCHRKSSSRLWQVQSRTFSSQHKTMQVSKSPLSPLPLPTRNSGCPKEPKTMSRSILKQVNNQPYKQFTPNCLASYLENESKERVKGSKKAMSYLKRCRLEKDVHESQQQIEDIMFKSHNYLYS